MIMNDNQSKIYKLMINLKHRFITKTQEVIISYSLFKQFYFSDI